MIAWGVGTWLALAVAALVLASAAGRADAHAEAVAQHLGRRPLGRLGARGRRRGLRQAGIQDGKGVD